VTSYILTEVLSGDALVEHDVVEPALLVEQELLHHGHRAPDAHTEVFPVSVANVMSVESELVAL
jgi:hypothetical protein